MLNKTNNSIELSLLNILQQGSYSKFSGESTIANFYLGHRSEFSGKTDLRKP